MNKSLKILIFFIFGMLLGFFQILPKIFFQEKITLFLLYLLLFLIGIAVGGDKRVLKMIREINIKIVLVPLSVIFGTFLGMVLVFPLLSKFGFKEILAIGFGFGYYSLSSVLIAKISGQTLGVIALLANIFREIITLLTAPLLAKYFGKLAPIASGGATSMDTTLPVIIKSIGKEYTIISIFSGFFLTILVPVLLPLILKF